MLRDGLGLGCRISGLSYDMEEILCMIVVGMGIGILLVDVIIEEVESGYFWFFWFVE